MQNSANMQNPGLRYSVIIPARNEEKFLPGCIESVRHAGSQANVTYEIIVVLNRCSDSTPQIAKDLGCRTIEASGKNLSYIRNVGAAAATGEIVITIDADSRMSPNMLDCIENTMRSGKYVGGGVLIKPERYSLGILMTGLMLLPIALYHRISAGLFYCSRQDFFAIHGFDEKLCSVEDIDFAKRLRQHGAKSGRKFKHLLRASITTSCRKFDHFGDWYFVLRPWLTWKLLGGRNQGAADRVWYNFNDKV
jgi:glycosyltransferase involved in cell wall biosynthesis